MTTNRFLSAKLAKTVGFMGLKVEIVKLTMRQTNEMKELALSFQDGDKDQRDNAILDYVIKNGAPELATIEELDIFPIDELGRLANEILVFSGLDNSDNKADPKQTA